MCSFFFFSSRRRHTRFDCDWSSDVCSSDLEQVGRCRRDCYLEDERRPFGGPRGFHAVGSREYAAGGGRHLEARRDRHRERARTGQAIDGYLGGAVAHAGEARDRKSTRLNSSHSQISYAVFCLKKKKNNK